jgi:hypothetical protein
VIGSYDNDWVISFSEGARFEFKADFDQGLGWISDREKPGEKVGTLSISSPEPATYDAFSIVMRRTGQVSQQPRVIFAGVGDKGTSTAAEFVCNPKYLDEFAQHAPKDWARKNVEFLIETRVFQGQIGVPRVVAYSIW